MRVLHSSHGGEIISTIDTYVCLAILLIVPQTELDRVERPRKLSLARGIMTTEQGLDKDILRKAY